MDRSTFARVLDRAKVPNLLLQLRAHTRSPWITALTYHRVTNPADAAEFDQGVVDASPADFDGHLAFLGRWFNFVGIDDLFDFRRGGRLPQNPLLLTFDDGYLDNFEIALPILKRHGAKAVFFIATHYLAERRLFWWDRISYLVKRSTKESLHLSYPRKESIALRRDRTPAIEKVLRVVKDHYALDLERFTEGVAEACGVSLSAGEERKAADRMLMTWDQVRALRAAGMDVQSHTSTHRVLQTLPPAELERELRGSRALLSEVLGEDVRAVSYPVGKALRYTPHIRTAVRSAGYELGFSNHTGINHIWDFDPLDARRISLEAALGDSYFRSMIALPYLAY